MYNTPEHCGTRTSGLAVHHVRIDTTKAHWIRHLLHPAGEMPKYVFCLILQRKSHQFDNIMFFRKSSSFVNYRFMDAKLESN